MENSVDELLTDRPSFSRNWANRTFSPLKKDSMRSSIFSMLMSAIGLGIFSFHKLFAEVGIFPAMGLIVVYGSFYLLCMEFIFHSTKINIQAKSFGELVECVMGKKYNVAYEFSLFVSLFMTQVAQLLSVAGMVYNNFGQAIFDFLDTPAPRRNEANFVFYCVIILGVIMFFVLLTNVSERLGYASLLAFSIFLGIAFTTLLQTPFYYQANGANLNLFDFTFQGYLHRVGLLIFAFNCLYNFYTVNNSLANPSITRLRKVFLRTFGVLVGLSVLLGTCFYLSLGPVHSATVDIFINRPKLGETDYAMIFFRSFYTVSLLVAFILTVEPCKAITGRLLSPTQNHYFSAFLFTAGPTAVACGYRQICSLMGISGALLTTFVVFTTPSLLAFKDNFFRKQWQRLFLCLFVAFTLVTGVWGSYLNLLDFRNNEG